MRIKYALLGISVLIAACGSVATPQAGSGDKLYQAMSKDHRAFISVIDSRSHQEVRRLPLGVPSVDWRHLYSLDSRYLVDTDPLTGATQGRLDLQHSYTLPNATATGMPGGLSQNGRWIVVQRYDMPDGAEVPSASQFVLVDTSTMHMARRVDLQGFFDFDAISNDGNRLYLIQFLNGKEYYVRLYDTNAGKLDPNPVVDKNEGGEAMAGLRLSGVASTNGGWLFSMYVRESSNPFVHALSLTDPLAFCLDLNGGGFSSDGNAMQWSLAMSPAGTDVYAANLASGDVARITMHDGTPAIDKTARIPRAGATAGLIKSVSAKEFGGNTAVVSVDGRTLAVAGYPGVVWLDTSTLAVSHRALTDWRITSLALNPSGDNLYALSDGGRIAQLSMSSASVVDTFDLKGGLPMALMRVAAA